MISNDRLGDTASLPALNQDSGHTSEANIAFLRAARAGVLEKVLDSLKHGVDINYQNSNGLNALHLASKEGHMLIVEELLARGADVDVATKKGNTALHISALAGKTPVVRTLVEHGAKVNVQSQAGFTALYMAAQENHEDVVRYLLEKGADPSLTTEEGYTPLAVALQQGSEKAVGVLLEYGQGSKVKLPALHIAAKKDDVGAAALLLKSDSSNKENASGFTPLHIAAHYGKVNVAKLLIDKGADVNYKAKNAIAPLHVAAKWGQTGMVALLLERNANINIQNKDGLTPLHCAARSGYPRVLDYMLEKGADHSAKTKNGLTPLHMATQGDHVDCARLLLHYQAFVDDVTVDYLTALHVAAHYGHLKTAKLLLDRNCEPNARALNGFTPLHIACKKNRIKIVELLLKNGALIEATTESGLTPLHVAAFMGNMNIVLSLLQNGAAVDQQTLRGETPLHLAARANQTDVMRILLRNKANVNAKAREQQTPLHISARMGNVDSVLLLLQHGAAPEALTKDGYTPLHIAAKEGHEEVAAVLVDQGAAPDAATKKGMTPVHIAAKYGQKSVARLLLQRGAAPDAAGKNGLTPLHVAAHYSQADIGVLLLESRASPHCMAKNGYTPLHIAAKKNQMDMATSLLEYGARPDTESKTGFAPLHLASQEGHTDMVSLLLEHKANANCRAANGLTPMHLCAQEDKVNVAEILYKYGAEIDPVTKAGYTPLHTACHFGQINMVRFLLQHQADVNATTRLGYAPLHQAAQQGHAHVVSLLLKHGASPDGRTNTGLTALHIARRLGYVSVEELLKGVTTDAAAPPPNEHTFSTEKYKMEVPEKMEETTYSDSEEEGDDDTNFPDHYSYLRTDNFVGLGDGGATPQESFSEMQSPIGSPGPRVIPRGKRRKIQEMSAALLHQAPALADHESLSMTTATPSRGKVFVFDPASAEMQQPLSEMDGANASAELSTQPLAEMDYISESAELLPHLLAEMDHVSASAELLSQPLAEKDYANIAAEPVSQSLLEHNSVSALTDPLGASLSGDLSQHFAEDGYASWSADMPTQPPTEHDSAATSVAQSRPLAEHENGSLQLLLSSEDFRGQKPVKALRGVASIAPYSIDRRESELLTAEESNTLTVVSSDDAELVEATVAQPVLCLAPAREVDSDFPGLTDDEIREKRALALKGGARVDLLGNYIEGKDGRYYPAGDDSMQIERALEGEAYSCDMGDAVLASAGSVALASHMGGISEPAVDPLSQPLLSSANASMPACEVAITAVLSGSTSEDFVSDTLQRYWVGNKEGGGEVSPHWSRAPVDDSAPAGEDAQRQKGVGVFIPPKGQDITMYDVYKEQPPTATSVLQASAAPTVAAVMEVDSGLSPDAQPSVAVLYSLTSDGQVTGPDGLPILGRDGQPVTLSQEPGSYTGYALAPDGTVLAPNRRPVVGMDGNPVRVTPSGHKIILEPSGRLLAVVDDVSVSSARKPLVIPPGSTLVAPGKDGRVRVAVGIANDKPLLDKEGKPVTLKGSAATLLAIAGPDGRAVCSGDGKPVVAQSGSVLITPGMTNYIVSLPDGRPVLDKDGCPICVPAGSRLCYAGPDGLVKGCEGTGSEGVLVSDPHTWGVVLDASGQLAVALATGDTAGGDALGKQPIRVPMTCELCPIRADGFVSRLEKKVTGSTGKPIRLPAGTESAAVFIDVDGSVVVGQDGRPLIVPSGCQLIAPRPDGTVVSDNGSPITRNRETLKLNPEGACFVVTPDGTLATGKDRHFVRVAPGSLVLVPSKDGKVKGADGKKLVGPNGKAIKVDMPTAAVLGKEIAAIIVEPGNKLVKEKDGRPIRVPQNSRVLATNDDGVIVDKMVPVRGQNGASMQVLPERSLVILGPNLKPLLDKNGSVVTVPAGCQLAIPGHQECVLGPDGRPVLDAEGQPLALDPGCQLVPTQADGIAYFADGSKVSSSDGKVVKAASGEMVVVGPDNAAVTDGPRRHPLTVPLGSVIVLPRQQIIMRPNGRPLSDFRTHRALGVAPDGDTLLVPADETGALRLTTDGTPMCDSTGRPIVAAPGWLLLVDASTKLPLVDARGQAITVPPGSFLVPPGQLLYLVNPEDKRVIEDPADSQPVWVAAGTQLYAADDDGYVTLPAHHGGAKLLGTDEFPLRVPAGHLAVVGPDGKFVSLADGSPVFAPIGCIMLAPGYDFVRNLSGQALEDTLGRPVAVEPGTTIVEASTSGEVDLANGRHATRLGDPLQPVRVTPCSLLLVSPDGHLVCTQSGIPLTVPRGSRVTAIQHEVVIKPDGQFLMNVDNPDKPLEVAPGTKIIAASTDGHVYLPDGCKVKGVDGCSVVLELGKQTLVLPDGKAMTDKEGRPLDVPAGSKVVARAVGTGTLKKHKAAVSSAPVVSPAGLSPAPVEGDVEAIIATQMAPALSAAMPSATSSADCNDTVQSLAVTGTFSPASPPPLPTTLPPGSLPWSLFSQASTARSPEKMIEASYSGPSFGADLNPDNVAVDRSPVFTGFLVSFMVDARGGAMRGCRHAGMRLIIPPYCASCPTRITCRMVRRERLGSSSKVTLPPLGDGEALAARVVQLSPVGTRFLGPVIIEIPHFASLRGREREIVVMRSDDGQTWKEHLIKATDELVSETVNGSFDDIESTEDLEKRRIARIVTPDFPQYFALVTRPRQESTQIGPAGGILNSTVVSQAQAVFPDGALKKQIRVGIQALPVPADVVARLLGNRVAVSAVVTVEPRRRRFHKPITLTIPVPKAAQRGMVNHYEGEVRSTLRLLYSISEDANPAQWEDITGSTPLTFVSDCVSFTTTLSARFWLVDCQNTSEVVKMATALYKEVTSVPFMCKFVVFAKHHEPKEARLRVFCMTDDKIDKTLETQEHFHEIARSRDIEVLEGKPLYVEMAGSLLPVTRSSDEQLHVRFCAFKENRLPFVVRLRGDGDDYQNDAVHSPPIGRIAFMRHPKAGKADMPQVPLCNLNLRLPDCITATVTPAAEELGRHIVSAGVDLSTGSKGFDDDLPTIARTGMLGESLALRDELQQCCFSADSDAVCLSTTGSVLQDETEAVPRLERDTHSPDKQSEDLSAEVDSVNEEIVVPHTIQPALALDLRLSSLADDSTAVDGDIAEEGISTPPSTPVDRSRGSTNDISITADVAPTLSSCDAANLPISLESDISASDAAPELLQKAVAPGSDPVHTDDEDAAPSTACSSGTGVESPDQSVHKNVVEDIAADESKVWINLQSERSRVALAEGCGYAMDAFSLASPDLSNQMSHGLGLAGQHGAEIGQAELDNHKLVASKAAGCEPSRAAQQEAAGARTEDDRNDNQPEQEEGGLLTDCTEAPSSSPAVDVEDYATYNDNDAEHWSSDAQKEIAQGRGVSVGLCDGAPDTSTERCLSAERQQEEHVAEDLCLTSSSNAASFSSDEAEAADERRAEHIAGGVEEAAEEEERRPGEDTTVGVADAAEWEDSDRASISSQGKSEDSAEDLVTEPALVRSKEFNDLYHTQKETSWQDVVDNHASQQIKMTESLLVLSHSNPILSHPYVETESISPSKGPFTSNELEACAADQQSSLTNMPNDGVEQHRDKLLTQEEVKRSHEGIPGKHVVQSALADATPSEIEDPAENAAVTSPVVAVESGALSANNAKDLFDAAAGTPSDQACSDDEEYDSDKSDDRDYVELLPDEFMGHKSALYVPESLAAIGGTVHITEAGGDDATVAQVAAMCVSAAIDNALRSMAHSAHVAEPASPGDTAADLPNAYSTDRPSAELLSSPHTEGAHSSSSLPSITVSGSEDRYDDEEVSSIWQPSRKAGEEPACDMQQIIGRTSDLSLPLESEIEHPCEDVSAGPAVPSATTASNCNSEANEITAIASNDAMRSTVATEQAMTHSVSSTASEFGSSSLSASSYEERHGQGHATATSSSHAGCSASDSQTEQLTSSVYSDVSALSACGSSGGAWPAAEDEKHEHEELMELEQDSYAEHFVEEVGTREAGADATTTDSEDTAERAKAAEEKHVAELKDSEKHVRFPVDSRIADVVHTNDVLSESDMSFSVLCSCDTLSPDAEPHGFEFVHAVDELELYPRKEKNDAEVKEVDSSLPEAAVAAQSIFLADQGVMPHVTAGDQGENSSVAAPSVTFTTFSTVTDAVSPRAAEQPRGALRDPRADDLPYADSASADRYNEDRTAIGLIAQQPLRFTLSREAQVSSPPSLAALLSFDAASSAAGSPCSSDDVGGACAESSSTFHSNSVAGASERAAAEVIALTSSASSPRQQMHFDDQASSDDEAVPAVVHVPMSAIPAAGSRPAGPLVSDNCCVTGIADGTDVFITIDDISFEQERISSHLPALQHQLETIEELPAFAACPSFKQSAGSALGSVHITVDHGLNVIACDESTSKINDVVLVSPVLSYERSQSLSEASCSSYNESITAGDDIDVVGVQTTRPSPRRYHSLPDCTGSPPDGRQEFVQQLVSLPEGDAASDAHEEPTGGYCLDSAHVSAACTQQENINERDATGAAPWQPPSPPILESPVLAIHCDQVEGACFGKMRRADEDANSPTYVSYDDLSRPASIALPAGCTTEAWAEGGASKARRRSDDWSKVGVFGSLEELQLQAGELGGMSGGDSGLGGTDGSSSLGIRNPMTDSCATCATDDVAHSSYLAVTADELDTVAFNSASLARLNWESRLIQEMEQCIASGALVGTVNDSSASEQQASDGECLTQHSLADRLLGDASCDLTRADNINVPVGVAACCSALTDDNCESGCCLAAIPASDANYATLVGSFASVTQASTGSSQEQILAGTQGIATEAAEVTSSQDGTADASGSAEPADAGHPQDAREKRGTRIPALAQSQFGHTVTILVMDIDSTERAFARDFGHTVEYDDADVSTEAFTSPQADSADEWQLVNSDDCRADSLPVDVDTSSTGINSSTGDLEQRHSNDSAQSPATDLSFSAATYLVQSGQIINFSESMPQSLPSTVVSAIGAEISSASATDACATMSSSMSDDVFYEDWKSRGRSLPDMGSTADEEPQHQTKCSSHDSVGFADPKPTANAGRSTVGRVSDEGTVQQPDGAMAAAARGVSAMVMSSSIVGPSAVFAVAPYLAELFESADYGGVHTPESFGLSITPEDYPSSDVSPSRDSCFVGAVSVECNRKTTHQGTTLSPEADAFEAEAVLSDLTDNDRSTEEGLVFAELGMNGLTIHDDGGLGDGSAGSTDSDLRHAGVCDESCRQHDVADETSRDTEGYLGDCDAKAEEDQQLGNDAVTVDRYQSDRKIIITDECWADSEEFPPERDSTSDEEQAAESERQAERRQSLAEGYVEDEDDQPAVGDALSKEGCQVGSQTIAEDEQGNVRPDRSYPAVQDERSGEGSAMADERTAARNTVVEEDPPEGDIIMAEIERVPDGKAVVVGKRSTGYTAAAEEIHSVEGPTTDCVQRSPEIDTAAEDVHTAETDTAAEEAHSFRSQPTTGKKHADEEDTNGDEGRSVGIDVAAEDRPVASDTAADEEHLDDATEDTDPRGGLLSTADQLEEAIADSSAAENHQYEPPSTTNVAMVPEEGFGGLPFSEDYDLQTEQWWASGSGDGDTQQGLCSLYDELSSAVIYEHDEIPNEDSDDTEPSTMSFVRERTLQEDVSYSHELDSFTSDTLGSRHGTVVGATFLSEKDDNRVDMSSNEDSSSWTNARSPTVAGEDVLMTVDVPTDNWLLSDGQCATSQPQPEFVVAEHNETVPTSAVVRSSRCHSEADSEVDGAQLCNWDQAPDGEDDDGMIVYDQQDGDEQEIADMVSAYSIYHERQLSAVEEVSESDCSSDRPEEEETVLTEYIDGILQHATTLSVDSPSDQSAVAADIATHAQYVDAVLQELTERANNEAPGHSNASEPDSGAANVPAATTSVARTDSEVDGDSQSMDDELEISSVDSYATVVMPTNAGDDCESADDRLADFSSMTSSLHSSFVGDDTLKCAFDQEPSLIALTRSLPYLPQCDNQSDAVTTPTSEVMMSVCDGGARSREADAISMSSLSEFETLEQEVERRPQSTSDSPSTPRRHNSPLREQVLPAGQQSQLASATFSPPRARRATRRTGNSNVDEASKRSSLCSLEEFEIVEQDIATCDEVEREALKVVASLESGELLLDIPVPYESDARAPAMMTSMSADGMAFEIRSGRLVLCSMSPATTYSATVDGATIARTLSPADAVGGCGSDVVVLGFCGAATEVPQPHSDDIDAIILEASHNVESFAPELSAAERDRTTAANGSDLMRWSCDSIETQKTPCFGGARSAGEQSEIALPTGSSTDDPVAASAAPVNLDIPESSESLIRSGSVALATLLSGEIDVVDIIGEQIPGEDILTAPYFSSAATDCVEGGWQQCTIETQHAVFMQSSSTAHGEQSTLSLPENNLSPAVFQGSSSSPAQSYGSSVVQSSRSLELSQHSSSSVTVVSSTSSMFAHRERSGASFEMERKLTSASSELLHGGQDNTLSLTGESSFNQMSASFHQAYPQSLNPFSDAFRPSSSDEGQAEVPHELGDETMMALPERPFTAPYVSDYRYEPKQKVFTMAELEAVRSSRRWATSNKDGTSQQTCESASTAYTAGASAESTAIVTTCVLQGHAALEDKDDNNDLKKLE